MDGKIVERAIAGARVATPCERRLRIGHEVLVHLDAELGDRADRAALQVLCDVTDCGTLDVVVAEDRDFAARARRRGHVLGVAERGRHRLFAPDVLARFKSGDRHRRVQIGRGRDRDDVDGRVGDNGSPVGRRRLEAEFFSAVARESLVDLTQRNAPHDWRVAEDGAHSRPGERMALAHIAGPDQSDPDSVHEARSRKSLGATARFAKTNISQSIRFGIFVLFIFRTWHASSVRSAKGNMSYDATTEPPESFDALKRRLIEIEPHLPKRLRQAAAYALEHPDEFALGTASALARGADVQASTLVRFAQTLGFAGFSDLQEVFRWRLRNRWPDYSERLRALQQNARDSGDPTHLLFGFADSAAASIARLREAVQRRELDRAVDLLASARTIHCLGQRRSFCVAHYLTYALSQIGIPASLIDNVGGLGPEEVAQAGADDALIAISFSPYAPFTVDLAKRARRAAVPIVVVTDSALSPLASLAEVRFEIAESDFGSFRSLSATFCLAMTLAVAVAEKRAEAG